MSIIIGGDIVPTISNQDMFIKGDIQHLFGRELLDVLAKADYRIFNLEVPLCDKQEPIEKCGPNLIADTRSVTAIKMINVDLMTLANNHIMDQGINGFESTIQTLKSKEIDYVGAGNNLNCASKPFYTTINGKCYGIYACAEHEFSIAENNKPGANPFEPLDSLDHIEEMKSQCDYAIVLYHGGKEHYRYPSPYLQKVCRKIVGKGADLVVCQHSHCIGCKEEYKNGIIVYGQGNFLFDGQDNEYWDNSLLILLHDDNTIEFLPIEKDGCMVKLSSGEKRERILNSFLQRSEEIKRDNIIIQRYREYADANKTNYIMHFSGLEGSVIFRIINKISGRRLKRSFVGKYEKCYGTVLRNFVECEAHRELLLEGLKKRHYDKQN